MLSAVLIALIFTFPLYSFADHEPGHVATGGNSTKACKDIIISKGFGQGENAGARKECTEREDCYITSETGNEFAKDVCRKTISSSVKDTASGAVRDLIYSVIVEPAASLFAWIGGQFIATVISPGIYQAIFATDEGNEFLYNMWRLVRNLLNVVFIAVLLLSAFSTIFQVQKWHLRSTLIKIVVMALLVNFSWPITRVFIDLGNVLMYGLLDLQVTTQNADGVVKSANIISLVAAESDTIDLLANKGTTITDVLVKGVFIILFVATFATVGIVFLLRIVMFVLLLVFSPVGFVASIFPGTQRFANMWWEALLKWTFIGPVVVLMLYVALAFITTFEGSLNTAASGVDANFFDGFGATMILYTAALAILWAGMIAAQQIGGGLATAAISRSRKVGSWTARRGWRGAKQLGRLGDNASVAAQRRAGIQKPLSSGRLMGRVRGVKQGIQESAKRQNDQFASRFQEGQARGAQAVGSQFAVENYNKKEKRRFKDEEFKNSSTNQLIQYAKDDTNSLRQEAAREHLATQKESIRDPEMLAKALNAMGDDVENAAKLISTATTKGAFTNVGIPEYDDLHTAIRTSGLSTADQARVVKDVDKKYTENGNVHVLVTHDVRSGTAPKVALENRLNISNKDAASQDKLWEGIDRDTDLQDYVKDNYVGNPQAHQDLFKQMSPKTRKAVSDVGLSP